MNIFKFLEIMDSEMPDFSFDAEGRDTRPYVVRGGIITPPRYGGARAMERAKDIIDALPAGTVVVVPKYSGRDFCGENHYTKTLREEWVLCKFVDKNGVVFNVDTPPTTELNHDDVLTDSQIRAIAAKYADQKGAIYRHDILSFGQDIIREVRNKIGIRSDLSREEILDLWSFYDEYVCENGVLKEPDVAEFARSLVYDLFSNEEEQAPVAIESMKDDSQSCPAPSQ